MNAKSLLAMGIFMWTLAPIQADEPSKLTPDELRPNWDKNQAANYLDSRQEAWFAWSRTDRGEGSSKTSCMSCHTLFAYALARPALRGAMGNQPANSTEKRVIDQTRLRVRSWNSLDEPAVGRLYTPLPSQSTGTEAILNAAILASDDFYSGRAQPSAETLQAFKNLWQEQLQEGAEKGAWPWMSGFNLEPWESNKSVYFGATVAALAVRTAPGYFQAAQDAALANNVQMLRDYLRSHFNGQNLYNQAWGVWASTALGGVLSPDQQKDTLAQLFAKQRPDGGWSLSSLGNFARHDGTAEDENSDGYATGLLLEVFRAAGVSRTEPRVAKGLAWLVANQQPTGEWRASSLNKRRDFATQEGKFMSDTATAYAVMALCH